MNRWFALLFSFIIFATPATAQTAPNLPSGLKASPSLWHVTGEAGEVYLLGAVHVLPPDMHWRTPAISRGLTRSDVFVFEVPEDAEAVAQLQGMVQAQGYLPPGQTLRAELHPAALPDYDAALKAADLAPAALERERPWLAGLQLMFAQMTKLKLAAGNGVDSVLMQEAAAQHKELRYLETIADQFALLAPTDHDLELEEFEASLKDLLNLSGELMPMIQAWSTGDQSRLDRLINGDLDQFPQARKTLLDDRNQRWLPEIQAMLKEKHVFFITVGAGHLTGPQGVPALLRKAGYKVSGP